MDTPALELYDAFGRTLQLLSRRLDGLSTHDLSPIEQRRLEALRSSTADAIRSLNEVTDALELRRFRGLPLDDSLRRIAAAFASAHAACVEVRASGAVSELPADVSDALLGVAREALVNVDRHSRATVVLVSLVVGESRVVLEVRDDGVGLAQRHDADLCSTTTLGLLAITRRVRSLGGRLAVSVGRPRGVRVRVVVPLGPPSGACDEVRATEGAQVPEPVAILAGRRRDAFPAGGD